jgi:hypothetical protein
MPATTDTAEPLYRTTIAFRAPEPLDRELKALVEVMKLLLQFFQQGEAFISDGQC